MSTGIMKPIVMAYTYGFKNCYVMDPLNADYLEQPEMLLKHSKYFTKLHYCETDGATGHFIHLNPVMLTPQYLTETKTDDFFKDFQQSIAWQISNGKNKPVTSETWNTLASEYEAIRNDAAPDKLYLFSRSGYFTEAQPEDEYMDANGHIKSIKDAFKPV